LFLLPAFERSLLGGFQLTANRFLGANLLHTLSSAIVGYALARHLFSPWKKHAFFFGVAAATILHTVFNYLILMKDGIPTALVLLVLLLALMGIVVLVDFERLKRSKPERARERGLDVLSKFTSLVIILFA
jgi:RsiW-degrading membrane proteinase PrsW (M82 family)